MSQVHAETRKMKRRKGQAQHKRRHPGLHKMAPARYPLTAPDHSPATQNTADLALPIEELDLSVRACNALKGVGVHRIGDLTKLTEGSLLLDSPRFPQKSIDEIKLKLASMGLGLRGSKLTPARTGG